MGDSLFTSSLPPLVSPTQTQTQTHVRDNKSNLPSFTARLLVECNTKIKKRASFIQLQTSGTGQVLLTKYLLISFWCCSWVSLIFYIYKKIYIY